MTILMSEEEKQELGGSTEIKSAIRQLNRSERGQQALYELRVFIKNNAGGLDDVNKAALILLLLNGFAGHLELVMGNYSNGEAP